MVLDEIIYNRESGYRVGEYRRVVYEEEVWDLVLLLMEKKIPYKVLDEKRSQDFKHAWEKAFRRKGIMAGIKSDKGRKNKNAYHYLWDALLARPDDCVDGPKALWRYQGTKREKCILHFPVLGVTILIKKADRLTLEAIEEMFEVMVTDDRFTWTFVKTHEVGCGPYFCEAQSLKVFSE